MILIFDTYYREDNTAKTACIKFSDFDSDYAIESYTTEIAHVEEYENGQFYKRELPCIMSVISKLDISDIKYIIVDSYVYLGDNKEGLGCKLFHTLGEKIPIIGIAKNKFKSENISEEVLRGDSKKPLYITSVGIDVKEAAEYVKSMYGEHRLPYFVKEVDKLCRN